MKKQKEIFVGIALLIIGFSVGILVALIVVNSNVISKANNDGWLSFFGGMFGSVIAGTVSFYILFINRRDSFESQIRAIRRAEMDKMESDLKEAFSLTRVNDDSSMEKSYFLLILNKIGEKYKDTKYYHYILEAYNGCTNSKTDCVLVLEADIYREFLEYRKKYIEEG